MTLDTTFLPLRSKFVYGPEGGEITLEMEISVRPWDRRTDTVGGVKIAAAGIPAAYIIRRDHIILVTLRFRETKWTGLHAMIAWGQAAEELTWYPDALEAESFAVYLHNPAAGEPITPTRSNDYPKLLELTISLRGVTAAVWDLDYYGGL